MMGIEDISVFLAYVLCILSSCLCVGYGALRWNVQDEAVEPADIRWAAEEDKAEQDL